MKGGSREVEPIFNGGICGHNAGQELSRERILLVLHQSCRALIQDPGVRRQRQAFPEGGERLLCLALSEEERSQLNF